MKRLAAAALLAVAFPATAEPLRLYNGRLFIPAAVNGVPTEALLDSAAEATLVDPLFATKAKLPEGTPQAIRGSGGEAKARIVEGVTVNALGLGLHPDAVVVTDLSDLSKRLIKRPTVVVVGRELFDAARLWIDIRQGAISVVSRATTPAGQRLDLSTEHGVEAIPVVVDGTAAGAEFDLGNGSDPLISRAFATRLGLAIHGKKAGGGIGGAVRRDIVTLPRLTIAGATFRNVTAAIDDQPTAGEFNVGTSILKHFLITADFSRKAVWLMPRPR